MPRTAVVLVAAGSGSRVGAGTNKVLLPLRGIPVLARSLRTVAALPYVDRILVVIRAEDADEVGPLLESHLPPGREAVLVVGGSTRHESEWHGLQALRTAITGGEVDVVVVHDGARPLAEAALFDAVVETAARHGAAVPAREQPGLVTSDGTRHVTGLVAVQTPQAFQAAPLLDAYTRADEDGFTGTDTAGCVATYTGLQIHRVHGPATNLKVTFADDLTLCAALLADLSGGSGA
jgi:2-C-methyl-D-erythritol 4-phosphate cytidylyltransferase